MIMKNQEGFRNNPLTLINQVWVSLDVARHHSCYVRATPGRRKQKLLHLWSGCEKMSLGADDAHAAIAQS